MFQCSHILCQVATLFHLSCESILHFVCFGVDVEEGSAGVIIKYAVLAKANELVVGKGAQDAISWRCEGLCLLYSELAGHVARSVHFVTFC